MNRRHELTWIWAKLGVKVKRNKDDVMNQHAREDESKDERRWAKVVIEDATLIRRERKRASIVHETGWLESIKSQWNWKGSSKLTSDWNRLENLNSRTQKFKRSIETTHW